MEYYIQNWPIPEVAAPNDLSHHTTATAMTTRGKNCLLRPKEIEENLYETNRRTHITHIAAVYTKPQLVWHNAQLVAVNFVQL